ncbi:hypothetical protein AVEN_267209-1 [Araneus ventricosus]|uniref:Uncharacterized protein n=1 Tax=Araneus ventricosus TaxID=182803 RepID=A0A4Y2L2R9_ARAVE|nr:hypothetical protein AVEN_267209-1 [Araneus ventricosus]
MLIRESTPLIGNNIIHHANLSDATELPTKGNQSIGQYLSVHKDSFSNPPTNRRLEEAIVVQTLSIIRQVSSPIGLNERTKRHLCGSYGSPEPLPTVDCT